MIRSIEIPDFPQDPVAEGIIVPETGKEQDKE